MLVGVAAGHPATVDAGFEILASGGSAADAAVAASLVSCVAETMMTGLLGGGHGIYWSAARREARLIDCFVAVPGLGAAPTEPELIRLEVPFGAELVHYAVGPASCAVPGLPAGLDALWRLHGCLPWETLVEPALHAPGGRLLQAGDVVDQPGLVAALELVADEGAAAVYAGTIRGRLLELMAERGGPVTADDLDAYRAVWLEPVEVRRDGDRFLTR